MFNRRGITMNWLETCKLKDGSTLELDPKDGTICRKDSHGNLTGTWSPDDLQPDVQTRYEEMARTFGGIIITHTYGTDNPSKNAQTLTRNGYLS